MLLRHLLESQAIYDCLGMPVLTAERIQHICVHTPDALH